MTRSELHTFVAECVQQTPQQSYAQPLFTTCDGSWKAKRHHLSCEKAVVVVLSVLQQLPLLVYCLVYYRVQPASFEAWIVMIYLHMGYARTNTTPVI